MVVGCSASAPVLRRSLQCSGLQDAARPQVRLIPPPHCISSYAPGLAFLPHVLYIWSAYTPSLVSLLTPLSLQFCLLVHCTENPIYVFPKMKLRGLVPNSYSHVSVSDL
jgi:hypothetical protein